MGKKQHVCTHLTTKEIKRESSSYVQHIALEKEQTSRIPCVSFHPSLLVLCCLSVQKTEQSQR